MISVDTLLTILGMIVSIVGAIWGVIRWADAKITRLEDRANKRIDEAHHRINELRSEAVTKEDLSQHIMRIEGAVTDLRGEFQAVHRRIDELLNVLAAKRASVD